MGHLRHWNAQYPCAVGMACGIFKLANHRTTKQLTARNESLPCSTVTQAADEVVVVIDDEDDDDDDDEDHFADLAGSLTVGIGPSLSTLPP